MVGAHISSHMLKAFEINKYIFIFVLSGNLDVYSLHCCIKTDGKEQIRQQKYKVSVHSLLLRYQNWAIFLLIHTWYIPIMLKIAIPKFTEH